VGTQLLSSTFQHGHMMDASLRINCRPNLLPRPCVRAPEATPRKWLGASDAASEASTCSRRASGAWSSSDEAELEPCEGRTTVMIRNLPEGLSRGMLERLLDAEGFDACYRFIYLPTDIATGSSFCYAFIDLATPEDARWFQQHFTGFSQWFSPSSKAAVVEWSEALQGVDGLVERYRNSPLMHPSVPDHLRPALYHNGRRAIFPAPTMPLKAPRVRRASSRRAQRLPGARAPASTL